LGVDVDPDRSRQITRLQRVAPVVENGFGVVSACFRNSFRAFEHAIGDLVFDGYAPACAIISDEPMSNDFGRGSVAV
jgi:hypothetical protein